MRILKAICFALLLSGCALSPELKARYDANVAAQRAAIDNADDAQCRGYGASPGSDAYVACRMNLANNRAAADAAQREAWAKIGAAGIASMSRPSPPPPALSMEDHVCVGTNNSLYRC